MSTARLLHNATDTTEPLHTKENIRARLNSDMTDFVRTAYLKTLLNTEKTALLLTTVAIEWKQDMLKEQIGITELEMKIYQDQIEFLKLEEKIRLEKIFIKSYQKYPLHDETNPERDTHVKISTMQAQIDNDTKTLNQLKTLIDNNIQTLNTRKSLYTTSSERGNKTLCIVETFIETIKSNLAEMEKQPSLTMKK